jgi:hypothetical protein
MRIRETLGAAALGASSLSRLEMSS